MIMDLRAYICFLKSQHPMLALGLQSYTCCDCAFVIAIARRSYSNCICADVIALQRAQGRTHRNDYWIALRIRFRLPSVPTIAGHDSQHLQFQMTKLAHVELCEYIIIGILQRALVWPDRGCS